MDLLAGYGSDASDSDTEQEQPPQASVRPPSSAPKPSFSSFLPPPKQSAPLTRPTTAPVNTAPAAEPASSSLPSDFFDSKPAARSTNAALPADFFQQEPAPSSSPDPAPEVGPAKPHRPPPSFDDIPSTSASTGGLWSALPKPKTRKVITLNVGPKLAPLARRPAPAPDADDDSPRPVKKSKPASKSALIDFLPAPKYSSTPTTFDFNPSATSSTDPSTSADPAPGPTSYPEAGPSSSHDIYSNEAYRADQPQQDYAYPASYDPSSYDPSAYASTSYDPTAYDPAAYAAAAAYPHPAASSYPAPAAAAGEPDLLHPGPNATAEEMDIFEAALKAERERVARTSGSKAAEEVKFVELNQQQLKYVHPAAQGTHDALKEALGSEYALQVRQEAKKYLGSKLARRRHQIGTLYHSAQVMELEMMEKRSQGLKSKKETAAKYGW